MPRVWNKTTETPPKDAVYVGRPTKWGNPYVITRTCTREQAITLYRMFIKNKPALMAALPELKGKDLICFCHPKACHADVLMELANTES